MPSRKGSPNSGATVVTGRFYQIKYMFMGLPIAITGMVGDKDWLWWVDSEHAKSFSFRQQSHDIDLLTVRREVRTSGVFWYAYRKFRGKLYKRYVGKEITLEALKAAYAALDEKIDKDDTV